MSKSKKKKKIFKEVTQNLHMEENENRKENKEKVVVYGEIKISEEEKEYRDVSFCWGILQGLVWITDRRTFGHETRQKSFL